MTLWNFRIARSAASIASASPATAFKRQSRSPFTSMAGTLKEVTAATPGRLLRSSRRQADRRRVRRAAGGEEHHPDRRGRPGRDPAGGREGRGGQLQGAGPGRAVGGDRRPAARFLAAAQPSPHLRRPAQPGADRRRPQPPGGRLEGAVGRCRAYSARLHAPRLPARRDRRGRQADSRPREGQAGREGSRSSRRCASA